MNDASGKFTVFLILVGVVVIAFAGFVLWAMWTDDGRPGYNPMSGKRAHYNNDGKLTGYSEIRISARAVVA
jgi:hypothetical protein